MSRLVCVYDLELSIHFYGTACKTNFLASLARNQHTSKYIHAYIYVYMLECLNLAIFSCMNKTEEPFGS